VDNSAKRIPPGSNYDARVVEAFGSEWSRFDQRAVHSDEALELFNRYFTNFPWAVLPAGASGFDAGCGSGRWARFVAPRVGTLHCIDASADALRVAARNLAPFPNCQFHLASLDGMPLRDEAFDFGYSLGVLHHIPDTVSALRTCIRKLKPGAPFLLYLYYAFDNRPVWFRLIWKVSDYLRLLLSRCPFRLKSVICDLLAATVYWPLARVARVASRLQRSVDNFPLSAYKDQSFYVMRTDALDRFGTRLEKRFSRQAIRRMMEDAGLSEIHFNEGPPYWVAIGTKTAPGPDATRPSLP
jgi:SAM-dependent methyltransferase